MSSIFAQRYHAIVANPPYIVSPSKKANEAYRERYVSAHRRFGLGAPFSERMFELAVPGGFIGQITGNAFMKREYGAPLVEKVFPHYDLTHIIDTSGAFIPGHGTPTVILFARNRAPASDKVRVVQGKRGEPGRPEGAGIPAAALVPACEKLVGDLGLDVRSVKPEVHAAATTAAAAWVVTACMVEDFSARHRLYERAPLPTGEHLTETCERIAQVFPANDWFDAAAGVNPAFAQPITRAASDRLRAGVAALEGKLWPHTDTAWMGDLLQLLDKPTRKRHAFCQTPPFVADFILDRTLAPAVEEFGLDGLCVLDPACGTGHFLLRAFWRLYTLRADPEDGAPEWTYPECARLALASLHGGDLNPAVVAMTEWRLALAYLDASQPRSFSSIPDLPIHTEVADALLAERAPGKIDHARVHAPAVATVAVPAAVPVAPPPANVRRVSTSPQLSLFGDCP